MDHQDEFIAVQPPLQARPTRQRAHWRPPPRDMLKINFDGALFTADKKSDIGVVKRNSQGLIIASLSQVLPQDYTVAEVEAFAAIRALQFARELDISETIIKALTDEHYPLTTYGSIIQEANLISMSFTKLLYSQH